MSVIVSGTTAVQKKNEPEKKPAAKKEKAEK